MNKELEIRLKIMNIYKYLYLHRKLSSAEILKLYIEYLKLSVCLGTNSPVFEENLKKYNHTNCYCYALGIDYPRLFFERYLYAEIDSFYHELGFISRCSKPYVISKKIENLYKDLETLNIRFYETDIDSQTKHDGYKIAFYNCDNSCDFHFFRQNIDGSWSEKQGYSSRFFKVSKLEPVVGNYKLVKTLEIVKPIIK